MKNISITARSARQKEYLKYLNNYSVIITSGAPGTGKTFLAIYRAVQLFDKGTISKIILVRPAVPTENIGHLPGDIASKFDPYLKPLFDCLGVFWTPKAIKNKLITEEIEIAPLAFMRGRTFNDCVLILDEAQNSTPEQMQMFLTRLGENVQCIITGDTNQSDLRKENGLSWALEKLADCPSVKTVDFKQEDVIRSDLVKELIQYIS